MERFFKIEEKDAYKFIDMGLAVLYAPKIKINLFLFDDWLHEKHGKYEEEKGLSMSKLLLKEYGAAAHNFIKTVM